MQYSRFIPRYQVYSHYAHLLTGRLGFSDDSDEFFIIENPSSILNDAAFPAQTRQSIVRICDKQ